MPRPRVSVVLRALSSISLLILIGCGGGGSSSSLPTGSFQLSVQATGGGGGTVSSTPAGIDCGQTCTASFSSGTPITLVASPAANAFFAGWSGACSGTDACKVTLTQNTSVTGTFSDSPVLTIALGGTGSGSVASNPSGISCGQTCSASFAPGTPVTLTATAATNSSFTGWTGGGCSTNPICTVTLSASEKVTATFNPVQAAPVLTVDLSGNGTGTVTSQPSGINCGAICSASFNPGTQVTLTATPGANSTFAGWTGGGCSGTAATCTVTLTANQTVTAAFSTEPALSVSLLGTGTGTVTSSPPGINCPGTCSANYAVNSQVTLTATPVSTSSFGGWGGACSGTSLTCNVQMNANQSVTATFNPTPPQLTVDLEGTGAGTVTSNPAGINCPTTCSANFAAGTQVTLTEIPTAGSNFLGWSNACSGFNNNCVVTMSANEEVDATFNPASLAAINHIIFMAQENRSFDHYLGALRAYWAANNIADQSLDGLPQFNPTTGIPPYYEPPPTNPGCDPAFPPPAKCKVDSNSPQIESFKLITQCAENPGDAWDESHFDWNLFNPTSGTPEMNGMVYSSAIEARSRKPNYYDTDGIRGMGYNDSSELNYYYFMATNFATSDRFFSPVMSRTPPNRMYLDAATSQGHVYAIPTTDPPLSAPPIFEKLQDAGITWKIYVNTTNSPCNPPTPACLLTLSTIQDFAWGQTIPHDYPNNIATMTDYLSDVQNGTLPQVAIIEPASDAGLDEHPTTYDTEPSNIQLGANYVATDIINPLMNSQSWKDSVFILTYDEFGGFYDHVPPYATVSPDGIKPVDLNPGDVCYAKGGPTCDFTYTGFRLPLIVVSPYTQKNYVSHTPADLTAILKLVETRFNIPPLTNRDAAQMDMTEFFNFSNPPWLTPPTPPAQLTNGACYVNKLP